MHLTRRQLTNDDGYSHENSDHADDLQWRPKHIRWPPAGAPKGQQLAEVRRGVYIIIVTPGRLNDFLEAGQVQRMGALNHDSSIA